ncbi:MAG: hypothetical protein Q4F81_10710 [Eubacteriales bacterium]|nr:hypothetical protein [Eubacteriales bacterium]
MSEYQLKTGKIGDAIIGTYKKIEGTVVGGYQKVENAFVNTFLEKVDDEEADAPASEK